MGEKNLEFCQLVWGKIPIGINKIWQNRQSVAGKKIAKIIRKE